MQGASSSPTPTPTPTPTPSPSSSPSAGITVDSTYPGYSTARIDDGIIDATGGTATTWASGESSTNPHWIQINLPAAQTLNTATIHWAYDANRSFYVTSQQVDFQYWTGSGWQTAGTFTYTQDQSSSTITFPAVTASQIRFYQPANKGNPQYTTVFWVTEVDYGSSATPTPTPTPTPSPIVCTSTSAIPAGFGSPYDVLASPSTLLISATCDTTSARIDLGKNDPLQYIYNTGYHYHAGLSGWMPMALTSAETLISGAWYPKTATVSLSGLDLTNTTHYALGYVCSWTGSQWKCGCRDSACTQSYWQIQSFKR